jgi:hypothetical protein
MSARASVFNTTLIGVETARGTRAAAVRRLLATGMTIKPNVPVKPFTPLGSKYPTTATRAKEMTEGTYEGELAYNDIVYILSGLLEAEGISTPTNATLTRRWFYNPAVLGPDDIRTYSIEMGSSVRAERTTYGLFDGTQLRITKDEAHISGSLFGQVMEEGITLSTGRNEIEQVSRGTHTGGTFTLTYSGQTTAAIAFDAPAAGIAGSVQTLLEALSNIAVGEISVTGPHGGPWLVEFTSTLGSQNITPLVIDGTLLTGGTGEAVTTTVPGILLADVPELPVDVNAFTLYVGDSLANEVQTITRQATGGTFTLTVTTPLGDTATTGNIAYNATGAQVQTALEGLSIINVGDVTVTGAASGPWVATFGGRFARLNMPAITFNDSLLTGVTLPALAVVQTTAGGLTLLEKLLEFEWSLDNRFNPRKDIRADVASFTEHVEKAPSQKLTVIMEHDSDAAGYMSSMRNKATKFCCLEAYGPLIETDGVSGDKFYNHLRFTWPFKFTNNDRADKDDTWASTFELTPINSSTLGGVIEVECHNQLAGLES